MDIDDGGHRNDPWQGLQSRIFGAVTDCAFRHTGDAGRLQDGAPRPRRREAAAASQNVDCADRTFSSNIGP